MLKTTNKNDRSTTKLLKNKLNENILEIYNWIYIKLLFYSEYYKIL